jgi:hypothetical protein
LYVKRDLGMRRGEVMESGEGAKKEVGEDIEAGMVCCIRCVVIIDRLTREERGRLGVLNANALGGMDPVACSRDPVHARHSPWRPP